MNKPKYVRRKKSDLDKWIDISNLFAKSLIDRVSAMKMFNELSASERTMIRNSFKYCDELRRIHYPQTLDESETNDAYVTSVMVDAHIIATEHKIDPLVAVMCVRPICKDNERIMYLGF